MKVAFMDSSNKVINVVRFDNDSENFENFYDHLPNISKHKVLNEGETAIIGEIGIHPVLKPYPSWIWNDEDGLYFPPSPRPEYKGRETYHWDEPSLSWKEDTEEMKAVSE